MKTMWCIRILLRPAVRRFESAMRGISVSVVGAASELGQLVCMLLRGEPAVTRLCVHDRGPRAAALLVDLSHIPMVSQLRGYTDDDDLVKSLDEADLVLATGGLTASRKRRKVDPTATNINFIKKFGEALARIRPMPFVGIATEPLNMTVPIAAEIIKSEGHFDPRRLFGICGADSLRAQAMYAAVCNVSAPVCSVPVVCGHSSSTIVPLFSQASPARELDARRVRELTTRVRHAADDVTAARRGDPPTLSAAHAVLRFTRAVAAALTGKLTPTIHAYVQNDEFGTWYFAGRMMLHAAGAGDMTRFPNLSGFEISLLERSIGQLREEILSSKTILEGL